MGWQIVKQEKTGLVLKDQNGLASPIVEGLYCVYSSTVEGMIAWNLSREDVIEFFAEDAAEDARRRIKALFEDRDRGIRSVFDKSWSEIEANQRSNRPQEVLS